MPNKQLTASVRINATQAERTLDNLVKKINKINQAVNKSGSKGLTVGFEKAERNVKKIDSAMIRVVRSSQQATSQANRLGSIYNTVRSFVENIKTKTQEWANKQKEVNSGLKSNNSLLGSIGTKLKGIAATYLGIMGAKAVVQTADTITSAENRLNALNGGDKNLTQLQMDKMYASAQKTRSSYTDMISNASKSMTLAGDAFQGNMDNAIRFQEIMSEAYTLGGASAQEQSTSMYQMIQALGSGTLAGDELRSVREGAPLAYKEIEKFAQKTYDCTDSLKDMASEGMITSEMVVAAIMNSGEAIDKQFKDTKITFAQSWDMMKNTAIKAFEPVLQKLAEIMQKIANSGAIDSLANAFVWLANVILNVINWIADNWEWFKYVLIGALIVIIAYFIILKWEAIKTAIANVASFIMQYWGLLLIVAAVMVILYAYEQWRQGTIDTTTFIIICLLAIAAICFVIFGWVVALVVACIAIAIWLFEYIAYLCAFLVAVIWDALLVIWDIVATIVNFILGLILWLLSVIWNIIAGVINAIIQLIWSIFVEPFIGIIEFILNACNGGFNSFGGAVANLLGQIISWFLSLGKVVTKIIDAIFGTDWTSGLSSLQDSVLSWGKSDESITISREAPELGRIDNTDAFDLGMSVLPYGDSLYVNPHDWGMAAYDWGSGVKDSVNQWGSQFQGVEDKSKDKTTGLPSVTDPTYDVAGAYKMPDDLSAIKDNTDNINDNLELAEDDLDFLRDLAEMEWRNEFTTAEIKVEMTNNNNINNEMDLDGVVSHLSTKLKEEMSSVAYGVHY